MTGRDTTNYRTRKSRMFVAVGALALGATVACGARAPVSLREAQLQDIEALEKRYIARDRALTAKKRAQAQQLADKLKGKAGQLNLEQLFLGIAKIVATADNGHSVLGFASDEAAPKRVLPMALAAIDGEGWLVLAAGPPVQDLAGMIVTEVEGIPAQEVLKRLSSYYGGTRERREVLAMGLVGAAGMLQAEGIAKSPDGVQLTLRDQGGHTVARQIGYVPRKGVPQAWWPSRWWSPEPISASSGWVTAISTEGLPLYLRNADRYFQIVELPDLSATYVQFWSNETDKGLPAFIAAAERQLRARTPRDLIVDLRFNKGGDLTQSADFMRRLPSLIGPDGNVYVILGRHTFSAGIVSAALIKKAAGVRAILVGENVGDRLRFWSEGDFECLPGSDFCARYTDGYFDLVDGCEGEPGCFRDNFRYDLVVGNLGLQLSAPMTTRAYLEKRDPAMEAIIADIRSRPPAQN